MQPKLLVQVNFLIDELKVSGAYIDGMLIGKIDFEGDQGRLKNMVPKSVSPYMPDIQVDEVVCMVNPDKAFFLKAALAKGFSLSDLPLVGDKIPSNIKIAIEDIEVSYASATIKGVNGAPTTPKGFNLKSNVILGEDVKPLVINQGQTQQYDTAVEDTVIEDDTTAKHQKKSPKKEAPANTGTKKTTEAELSDKQRNASIPSEEGITWIDLNKTLGPIHIQRIGAKFSEGELQILLSASLAIGPLKFAMEGLSIKSSLTNFSPKFNLDGLGLVFQKGKISIIGVLLREQIKIGKAGETIDTYNGLILIKAGKLTIAALGAYCTIDNQSSLFIYGYIGASFGGPPEFFVTGLAAGFGYNRELKIPSVDKVNDFPLVGVVTGQQKLSEDPFKVIKSINTYIPPALDQYFLTFGVKFTSYNIIDSFALLYFGFGKKMSLGIIGVSKLNLPPQVGAAKSPVLAQFEMAFIASYDFEEKAVKIVAALTDNSFILSRNCHLTGGFAFYCWFGGEHAGDLVCTAGGYHPDYAVPDHYPTVAKLGLSWRISNNLSVKGNLYFALTSSACMVGGKLEAAFQLGNVKAWFQLAIDLILSWKPFYYSARFSVAIGVSFTISVTVGAWKLKKTFKKSFNVSLSALLHVWGPEFSGIAKVKLNLISFEIKFGGASKKSPAALSWNEFKESFLPISEKPVKIGSTYKNELCTLNITNGLLKTTENKLNIVNPKEFALSLGTPIPISNTVHIGGELDTFGIATMGVKEANSSMKISITKDGGSQLNAFELTPVKKRVSPAMWGRAAKEGEYTEPDIKGKPLPEMLTGFNIVPRQKEQASQTAFQPLSAFKYDTETRVQAFDWQNNLNMKKTNDTYQSAIASAHQKQQEALAGLENLVDLQTIQLDHLHDTEGQHAAFLVAPHTMEFTSNTVDHAA